jgi:hypothetical protein
MMMKMRMIGVNWTRPASPEDPEELEEENIEDIPDGRPSRRRVRQSGATITARAPCATGKARRGTVATAAESRNRRNRGEFATRINDISSFQRAPVVIYSDLRGFIFVAREGLMRKAVALIAAVAALASVSTSAWAANDGKNRKVVVQNLSSQAIYNLYASPITSTNWEEDLLGQGTIPSGGNKTANIDNGTTECYYDLKVVMANGKAYEHRKVNVCAANKWVIGDSGESLQ